MYQPYPGGDSAPQTPGRRPVPPAVRNAIRLMYAGAATSVLSIVIILAAGISKDRIHQAAPKLTPSQVNSVHSVLIASVVLTGVIGTGLWLLNAWGCSRGANWARILGTVFFGINTLSVFAGLSRQEPALDRLYPFLPWLIGAGAVYFLWQRESSEFFTNKPPAA